jgi:hypothetical protein
MNYSVLKYINRFLLSVIVASCLCACGGDNANKLFADDPLAAILGLTAKLLKNIQPKQSQSL